MAIEDNYSKSAPEFSFYHKVKAFFEGDSDFEVSDIDERECEFTIFVHDFKKHQILKRMLYIPPQAARLAINIEYTAKDVEPSDENLAYLLSRNAYFANFSKDEDNSTYPFMSYILMKPEIVQYYDDIFSNPYGYDTKTAEQLARELFHGCKCNITTDRSNN